MYMRGLVPVADSARFVSRHGRVYVTWRATNTQALIDAQPIQQAADHHTVASVGTSSLQSSVSGLEVQVGELPDTTALQHEAATLSDRIEEAR